MDPPSLNCVSWNVDDWSVFLSAIFCLHVWPSCSVDRPIFMQGMHSVDPQERPLSFVLKDIHDYRKSNLGGTPWAGQIQACFAVHMKAQFRLAILGFRLGSDLEGPRIRPRLPFRLGLGLVNTWHYPLPTPMTLRVNPFHTRRRLNQTEIFENPKSLLYTWEGSPLRWERCPHKRKEVTYPEFIFRTIR